MARALVGRPVKEIFFAFDHLKHYEERLTGRVVNAVDTYGKGMVTRFDNHLNIYTHNQLYGRWMIRDPYDYPKTKRQLRLAIHNDKKSALLYSASDIEVVADGELDDHPFLSRIGPDLLHKEVTVDQIVDRFNDPKFRRKKLYSLLLDQGFLAGVGNYLRSEILAAAGVHPHQRPMDCTMEQLTRLGQAAVELTRQSYQTQGITNDLQLANQLKKEGVPRSKYRHRVFNREGSSCFSCGTPIIKDVLGGRRVYMCPACQPQSNGPI